MASSYHYMQLPREVIVGKGTLNRVAEVTQRLGFTGSALIIAGQKSCEVAGQKVRNQLQQTGMNVDTILVETVTMKDISAVEDRIKIWKPRIIFAVGGGTKIDAAKLSSARQHVPFISVPTTVSHDGIAGPFASIKGLDKPYSALAQAPLAIIADTEVIAQAPWRSVISGCGDVISKFTAVKDWQLAHAEKNEYYGEYAASLALMSAKLVTQNAKQIHPGNEEGLRVLLEALISCGVAMSIAGSSRPCSGSEHLFSHALDMINSSHAMHGEQCGVGAIMIAYLHGANWKRIKETLKRIKAPTTAAELQTKDEDVVKALQMAATIRPERYTILHKLNLNRDACEKVAKNTGVTN
ncbi:MAG TPA: NAD(P)-dependent glycerol-1-phosphate dehydrogenase [Candidatus Bathyarchaeia archaeon]|nr:NAD(P)-dependent glycerol-1-phosphate dehydrogenase [Candidatus Bathyarchaeia archaeon]